eukprot:975409-Pelagomonas_calceolata.AAC.1
MDEGLVAKGVTNLGRHAWVCSGMLLYAGTQMKANAALRATKQQKAKGNAWWQWMLCMHPTAS